MAQTEVVKKTNTAAKKAIKKKQPSKKKKVKVAGKAISKILTAKKKAPNKKAAKKKIAEKAPKKEARKKKEAKKKIASKKSTEKKAKAIHPAKKPTKASKRKSLEKADLPKGHTIKLTKASLAKLAKRVVVRRAPGHNHEGPIEDLYHDAIESGVRAVLDSKLLPAQAEAGAAKFTRMGLQKINDSGLGIMIPATVSDHDIRDADGGRLLREHNAAALKAFTAQVQSVAQSCNMKINPRKVRVVFVITDHTSKTPEELRDHAAEQMQWFDESFENAELKKNATPTLIYLNDPKIQTWLKKYIPEGAGKAGKGRGMLIGKLYMLAKNIKRLGYFDCEVDSLRHQPDFIANIFYSLLEQSPTNMLKANQLRVHHRKGLADDMRTTFGRVNNLVSKPLLKALSVQMQEHLAKTKNATREQLATCLALKVVSEQVPTQLSGEGSIKLFDVEEMRDARKKGIAWPASIQGLDWSVEIVDLISWVRYEVLNNLPENIINLNQLKDIEKIRLGVAISNVLHYEHKHQSLSSLTRSADSEEEDSEKDSKKKDGMAPEVIKGAFSVLAEAFGGLDFVDVRRLRREWKANAKKDFIIPTTKAQPDVDEKGVHSDLLRGQLSEFTDEMPKEVMQKMIDDAYDAEPERIDFGEFLDIDEELVAQEDTESFTRLLPSKTRKALAELIHIVERGERAEMLEKLISLKPEEEKDAA